MLPGLVPGFFLPKILPRGIDIALPVGNLSPMAPKHRNQSEQSFWDRVFEERYPKCIEARGEKGEQYCFHLAAETADLALAERRRSQQQDR